MHVYSHAWKNKNPTSTLRLATLAWRWPTCLSKLSSLGTKSLGLPSIFEQITHCIWCTLHIVTITDSTQGSCILHLFWKCLTISWSHFFFFVFGIGFKFKGSSKGVMQVKKTRASSWLTSFTEIGKMSLNLKIIWDEQRRRHRTRWKHITQSFFSCHTCSFSYISFKLKYKTLIFWLRYQERDSHM